MEDTSKYLIHATVTASGVVERSDVVGAIFGQTEGLLGAELDLRDLRRSKQVGRIDVEITSSGGTSSGTLTIATSLDTVETATLAAALETVTHVGPCSAEIRIAEIEDVRAAKRREVVDRAKELLETGFDDTVMSSEEILAEVREHVRVEDITTFEGLPAGPHVEDGDAIIVVEGRADVLTLLRYGVKNAIAVEGTDIPESVANLTEERTATAFLDGDRGGDLILEELVQRGDVDFVAFAPEDRSVEDLNHHEVFTALRQKVPYETVSETTVPREAIAATDGSATPSPPPTTESIGDPASSTAVEQPTERTDGTDETDLDQEATATSRHPTASSRADTGDSAPTTSESPESTARELESSPTVGSSGEPTRPNSDSSDSTKNSQTPTLSADTPVGTDTPSPSGDDGIDEDRSRQTIYDHATDIIRTQSDRVRFLDESNAVLGDAGAGSIFEELDALDTVPSTIILDSIADQQLVDVAADYGVDRIIAHSLGQFTKRPTAVSLHTIDDVAETPPDSA